MNTQPSSKSFPTRQKPAAPKPVSPRYHPATGQILSEVEDDQPYIPRRRAEDRRRKPGVTIAPSTPNGPDVTVGPRG